MYRLFIVALVFWFAWANSFSTQAEDSPPKAKEAQAKEDDSVVDADNQDALLQFFKSRINEIVPKISSEPEEAQKLGTALMEALDKAEPKTESGKKNLAELKGAVSSVLRRAAVARKSFDDVVKALRDNPDGFSALSEFDMKLQLTVDAVVDEDPEKATEIVEGARKLLTDLQEKAEGEATKNGLGRLISRLAKFDRSIKAAKQIQKLVGTEAVPLEAEAWVNGSPLTDADLKGKVVLLDFWAIWCGPCIATFPHLREWQEKYADKGLVIIGVTSYYSFDWDEEDGRPARAPGTSHEKEREMLTKFAKHHKLNHRFALEDERSLAEHYAVNGIPHVVLIDRQGKVAMIRIGNSPQNAKAIEGTIEKLISKGE
jgi:thiol-disulfide isomerase/thioredoxin